METKITAAIVEDEQGNRENLLRMVETHCPQIRISAICSSVTEARSILPEAKPDILFLDIRLGDDTGFTLLENLPVFPFELIFTTAYDSYAIQAIRFSALDYLLKPIDKNELSKMMKRFIEKVEEEQLQTVPFHILLRSLSPLEQTLIIPSPTNDLQFLRPENIGYFKYNSDRKQWEAYLNNATTPVAIRKNIAADQILGSSPSFIQIHQSYIININYLIMIKDKKCVFYPPFDNIHDLQVSKLYLKKLQEKFLML